MPVILQGPDGYNSTIKMTTKTTRESVLKEITDQLEPLCLDYMADCNHNLENNKPSPPIWEYLKMRLKELKK